jgi:hypothetical protein
MSYLWRLSNLGYSSFDIHHFKFIFLCDLLLSLCVLGGKKITLPFWQTPHLPIAGDSAKTRNHYIFQ